MKSRAKPSGITLTERDAAIIKAMLARGDRQHDIAAWFGVNGGRVAQVASGEMFPGVAAADPNEVPPPGPYIEQLRSAEMLKSVKIALDDNLAALARIESEFSGSSPKYS